MLIDRLFQGALNLTRIPQRNDFPPELQKHFERFKMSMHFFLRWRIKQLDLEPVISRYQYHLIDFTFARGGSVTMGGCNASSPRGSSWWWNSSDLDASGEAVIARTQELARRLANDTASSMASVCAFPDLKMCSCTRTFYEMRWVWPVK